ncbi:hypothetical protein Q1695_015727 [Nippostrongylus brasiliensis]|nr:hypothetical protein Q1695_015727 [Nippostrongylus brasiliensis]
MERVRTFTTAVQEFWQGVIEWRSPASAPYLMLVNMAFWSAALYCSELVQLRILLSMAAGVVGWDILLSPTHERSIATHVALWPVQSIWRTLSVCGCLYSSHQLKLQELETACISAYATVACLLVNPVWQYYEVNQKIVNGTKYCGRKVADGAVVVIVHPLQKVYRAVKYVVLLQFVPPLWRAMKSFFSRVHACIKGGIWCVLTGIKDSIIGTYRAFKRLVNRIRTWISMCIVEPTKNFIYAVGRFLRYWLCAHWWPDLKQWIKIKIGEPLRRLFNYFCYGLVYVFCGHWIPPLRAWLGHWLGRFRDFTWRQMCRFGAFLHRTVVVPSKRFLWRKFEELRAWLRRCLHRLAVAIRDSVIWPICLLVVDAARELSQLVYRLLFKPVLDYMYQRYKIIETAILIYFLGPVCDTIVKNIPEKSPFCDDSDVELEGMLPDEITDEVEEVAAGIVATSEGEDSLGDIEPPSPLDDEDHFVSGLAFPTIHASESSDDEFDLTAPKKSSTHTRRKRQKKDTLTDNGAAPEVPVPDPAPLPQRRRTNGRQNSFDDEFELLQ